VDLALLAELAPTVIELDAELASSGHRQLAAALALVRAVSARAQVESAGRVAGVDCVRRIGSETLQVPSALSIGR
jgi:hypothetical protein